MREIIIAGASGWLGQKIARSLLARGAKPRLMVRGGSEHPKAVQLAPLLADGAMLVDADVSDIASLRRAMDGIDVIVSALQGGPDIIVEGQRALANVGHEVGAERIFPSDFCVDLVNLPVEDHLFLGWRTLADRAIADTGLPQTNIFNGAFTDMLLEPFFGLIDWNGGAVTYWGDADQDYDFTVTDDVAHYVAAASMDDAVPDGPLRITGDTVSPRRIAEIASRCEGRPFELRQLGNLDDLNSEISSRQSKAPDDPMAWVGLQYHRAMASGAGKLLRTDKSRYGDIVPMSVEEFLTKSTV